jgi:plastocyanin
MSRLLPSTVLACAALVATTALTGPAGAASATQRTTPAYVIKISNFGFHGDLTVKTGATVKVKNKDSVTHTFTSRTNLFDTGRIAPGTAKTFTAPSKPGRYAFHCKIHAEMTGTLIVKRHP